MVRGVPAAALALLMGFAGCSLLGEGVLDDKPLENEVGGGGSGGQGATTSVGGGGGTGGCQSPAHCDGIDTTCQFRVCEAGSCGMANAEAGTTCTEGSGAVCDGLGACVACLDNDHCGQDQVCDRNFCVAQHCLDGMANETETGKDCGGPDCKPCPNGQGCDDFEDCTSKFCDAGTCMPCASQTDCDTVGYCEGSSGTCKAKKVLNEPCGVSNECLSGHCVDGVCCDGACDGTCVTCSGMMGECSPVPAMADPADECGAIGGQPCGPTGAGCNGDPTTPGCIIASLGTVCASASCANGAQSAESTCDGMGTCVPSEPVSCAPYGCSGNACADSCADNNGCMGFPNTYCNGANDCVSCMLQSPVGGTTISCAQNGQCQAMTVNCPTGADCTVQCTGNSSCANATINCPVDASCLVVCGDNQACNTAQINCGDASCQVQCDASPGSCTDAIVNCGNGPCASTCEPMGTTPSMVSCPSSCDCVTCS